ncbi:MAG: hypothetical protein V3V01_13600, partial [Acidimicrobiales bacterium]
MASIVAQTGTLDLDDISAKVSQELRTPWTGEHPAEVENPNPVEWEVHCFGAIVLIVISPTLAVSLAFPGHAGRWSRAAGWRPPPYR